MLPTIEGKVNADVTESKVLNDRRFVGRCQSSRKTTK